MWFYVVFAHLSGSGIFRIRLHSSTIRESSLSADDLLNYALKGAGIPFDPFSLPTSSVVAEYLPTNPIKTGSLIQREYGLRNIIDVSPVTVSTLNTPLYTFQFPISELKGRS